jgi:hypothetical protein
MGWWTIGVLGFDSQRGLGILLFTTASRTALGLHPASYTMGTRVSFPGSKAAAPWSYTFTPPRAIRLHGVVLSLKKTQEQMYFFMSKLTGCFTTFCNRKL